MKRRIWSAGKSRPWRNRVLALFFCASLLVGGWAGGFVWYAFDLPQQIENADVQTDAIVVLTGGSERLGVGLALLRQKLGRKLFVSGVYRGVEVADLLRQTQQPPEALQCCIVLGHVADNTVGNAVETAAWMRSEGFHSLRLVTSNYHMRRSLLEFRLAMPDVTIVSHPVFPDKVRRDGWWMKPGTAQLIASEYNKYLAAQARHWIEGLETSQ